MLRWASDGQRVPIMDREASSQARILIVGVQALVRAAITNALAQEPDLEIVGESENNQEPPEIFELCRKLQPDLVLMSLDEETESRLEIAKQIKDEHPQTVVLTLISQENEDVLLGVARAGFGGYVPTTFSAEQLVAAIRVALRGGTPINRELAMKLLQRFAQEKRELQGEHYIEPV